MGFSGAKVTHYVQICSYSYTCQNLLKRCFLFLVSFLVDCYNELQRALQRDFDTAFQLKLTHHEPSPLMWLRFLLVSVLFIAISGNCQKISFLVGPQLAFPNGDFKLAAGTGFGASFRFDCRFSERFYGIASIDGISFAEKSNVVSTINVRSKFGIEALQVGGRFSLINNGSNKLYFSGELGMNNMFFKLSTDVASSTSTEIDFCYRISLGYIMKRWDLNGSQQFITSGSNSLNYFSLRLGYFLKFKQ